MKRISGLSKFVKLLAGVQNFEPLLWVLRLEGLLLLGCPQNWP